MIFRNRLSALLMPGLLAASMICSAGEGVRQDTRAVEVLKSMSAYTASLDRVTVESSSFTDARLGGGLMVANASEVRLSIDRPGSAHISSFDGVNTKELFFHAGKFTVFNSENQYYAQTEIPGDLEAAMEFLLEDLGVEAPLMDLMRRDLSTSLIGSQDMALYLQDKARVAGVDCHHLAIRGAEADVQLWVEEGERPILRKIVITSKWEGGSPRFTANLKWDTNPGFGDEIFEFKAPEGSMNIGFLGGTGGGE